MSCKIWTVHKPLHFLLDIHELHRVKWANIIVNYLQRRGPHIHLSNITQIYFHFFLLYRSSSMLYKHQTFVYTFPFPLFQTPDINYHPQQALPTKNLHVNTVGVCVTVCAICALCMFFYTLHELVKARTKTLPTCIWADTVFQTKERDREVNWLFFYGN